MKQKVVFTRLLSRIYFAFSGQLITTKAPRFLALKWNVVLPVLLLSTLFSCDYKPKNQGKALYLQHCQSCHMEQGQGLGKLMPPIANADFVKNNSAQLSCFIRNGLSEEIVVNGQSFNGNMLGYPQLTETEISNLVYYIMIELNQMEQGYNIKEIREQLEGCN